MRIRLVHFRTHQDSEFYFVDGTIVLIEGESGVGKSTIFDAIYWCLYGSMREIKPRVETEGRTCVMIELDAMTITRLANPNLFQVSINKSSQIYQDAEAQDIVNSIFGNKNQWKTCSYIVQDERCALLNGSNKEKMDFLRKLSFSDENPKEVIARIDEYLKQYLSYDNRLQIEHQTEHRLYKEQLTARPVTLTTLWSPQDITNTQNYITQNQLKLTQMKKEVLEQERLAGVIAGTQHQVTSLEHQLQSLPINNNDDIQIQTEITSKQVKLQRLSVEESQLQMTIRMHTQICQAKARLQQLQKESDALTANFTDEDKSTLSTMKPVDNSFILRVQSAEMVQEKGKARASLYQIEYDKNVVDEEIVVLQQILEEQTVLQRQKQEYQKYQSQVKRINDEVSNLNNEAACVKALINTYYTDEIYQKNKLIHESLVRSKDILACPHCQGSLRYVNGCLEKANGRQVTEEEICSSAANIKKMQEQMTFSKKYDQLSKNIADAIKKSELHAKDAERYSVPTKEPLSEAEVQKMRTRINGLKSITFINQEFTTTSAHLVLVQQWQHMQTQLIQSKRHIESIVSTNALQQSNVDTTQRMTLIQKKKKTLDEELKILQTTLNSLQQLKATRTMLEQQLQTAKMKLLQLSVLIKSSLKNECEKIEIQLTQYSKSLNEALYAQKMNNCYNALNEKRKQVIQSSQSLANIYKLRSTAIEVECEKLEAVVNAINTAMNDVLTHVFDEPITVNIQLYRELKTKKQFKQNVNLYINYKGSDGINFHRMSGGEKDRISYALIIALNMISGSPVLLLDETLASLNSDLRSKAIQAMRSCICGSKTVICINHSDIHGNYDRVITL